MAGVPVKPTGLCALAFLLASLTGCGVLECVDMLVPRPSKPIPGVRTVALAYGELPVTRVAVACERYYDAMCSARGNSWAVREVGTTEPASMMRFIVVNDPVHGEVRIPRPSCLSFAKSEPQTFWPMVYVRGKTYFYAGTEPDGHVFVRRKFARQKIEPSAIRSVTLRFTLSVDGKALLPPVPEPT